MSVRPGLGGGSPGSGLGNAHPSSWPPTLQCVPWGSVVLPPPPLGLGRVLGNCPSPTLVLGRPYRYKAPAPDQTCVRPHGQLDPSSAAASLDPEAASKNLYPELNLAAWGSAGIGPRSSVHAFQSYHFRLLQTQETSQHWFPKRSALRIILGRF